ncbi:LuxR family transcriptional regulator [Allorhizobium sonneratiae]|uniref:LuxR family transcriptional regulator n=1 Tax=Allorhizobium sonneratiae TaxID=2934936 RepID=UPI002034933C|nr:autoinducer binding domain-containing protein [Allorhizobium sonneratiae]
MVEDVSSRLFYVEYSLRELAGLKTQFDIFRLMKRVTEEFGARYFLVMHLPSVTDQTLSGSSVISNWPTELMSLYDQAGLMATSPVFTKIRACAAPVVFDVQWVAREREARTVELARNLFVQSGMPRGACFPVHDGSGNRGMVSFCGDMPAFSFLDMTQLHYIATHVYSRLAEIREMDARIADNLTDREIECLNWTSIGKTSIEISDIMGLSEHTINHYLNRAARKLDTVNRTQAVAKALRLGLIK